MLAYLARVVPLHLDRIVVKVCHVIVNFCAHKNVGNSVSLQVSFMFFSILFIIISFVLFVYQTLFSVLFFPFSVYMNICMFKYLETFTIAGARCIKTAFH